MTESATPPLVGDAGWSSSAPTTYTFAAGGTKILYAWAKDAAGNVSASLNASVTITITQYNVGGTINGLTGHVFLQNNGGDNLISSSDGVFSFNTPLNSGVAYSAAVAIQPTNQTCTVTSGSGTISAADVTNVVVSCVDSPTGFVATYLSTDVHGVKSYTVTSDYNGPGTHVTRVLEPDNPATGVAHNFLYVLPVRGRRRCYSWRWFRNICEN